MNFSLGGRAIRAVVALNNTVNESRIYMTDRVARFPARLRIRSSVKSAFFYTGVVPPQNERRSSAGVIFSTVTGGENPGPGVPSKNRHQSLGDVLKLF